MMTSKWRGSNFKEERRRDWDMVLPHYERVFQGEMSLQGRFYRNLALDGRIGFDDDELYSFEIHDDLMIMHELIKQSINEPRLTYGMREESERFIAHYHTIIRTWQALGAPLFEAGPIMTEELKSMAELGDRVSNFIPRLMSRLPFEFFYLRFHRKREGVTNHIEGAYILNSRHNGTPSLCIIVDDGFSLDPWYCEANTIGDAAMVGGCHHYVLREAGGVKPCGNQRYKASSVLNVLHGLIEYLEAVDRETIDPTPAIRAALQSGKKSKIRKALNQMVGKRKIWIEPTLERKAREQGITGDTLKSGHVRRGHLHTYYTGAKLDADGLRIPKEKRKKVVKFVAPTWVGPRTITAEPRQYGIKAKVSAI